ncbi:putative 2,3-dihydroxybiphenyl 1,2-dioxygenase [Leptospira broomii serovar Hurstbridge str. 5399]|uniref:2,3-dihydroxybiphenyl 1,2-dioxygenase n=1 Tax=Leptospira broomii serovar Hurstbridge str. 5399 TaxID=1049789 RepID=T0FGM0_9LEPT|nr:VOC family protein [Leptospira broomii]EQA46767.1 putative 2,3-dihydroxybiphenyl 1,2-dioxygenase [Leptospira broomii serovar Hurstbridge str. 5399]
MFKGNDINIFNSVKLGYAVIESNRLKEWYSFGKEAIGLHAEFDNDECVCFRLDKHKKRFLIRKGGTEDFTSLGFQIKDENSLNIILDRLKKRKVTIIPGEAGEAVLRGVKSFWQFVGPKGLNIELFIDPILTETPLKMSASGFVTEEFGMGHVAMVSKRPEELIEFWKEIFGARISDYIEQKMSGVTLDIVFLRMNPRHHSVAVAATRGLHLDPISTRIQHLNIEAKELKDVTGAYLRCKNLGFEIARGIGQHPNDLELSFYVITPSGFELEVGWNPIPVDEIEWKQNKYKQISSWGHRPEMSTTLSRFREFRRGIFSLFRSEYAPF